MSDEQNVSTEETKEVTPGSDEYNQEMADKFQQQQNTPADSEVDEVPIPPMPENGYEKFYNKENGEYDWQNHAKELQYRLEQTNQPNAKTEEQNSEVQQNGEEQTEQQAVNSIIDRAGLESNNLRQQLEDNGDFDADTYKKLNEVGVTNDLIKSYVDNLAYRREKTVGDALDYVGGEDAWRNMNQWAVDNLNRDEISKFNELLASDQWKIGVDAMKVRMGSNTFEPHITTGNQLPGTTYGYRSKSEMKTDMSNPKYKSDPVFRREVMAKIQSATWDAEQ
tara:strand:- start:436 stop:1272 length:837 start_codon:yes stop_codon:yes gene_type:complete